MKPYFLKVVAWCVIPVTFSFTAAAACNDSTIKGRYALIAHGVQGTAEPFRPFNAVRTSVFDGKGSYTGSGWWTINGVASEYSSSGTYSVSKNCNVTIDGGLSDGTSNTQFGLIVDGGKKIFAIRKEDGNNISIIYEKQ